MHFYILSPGQLHATFYVLMDLQLTAIKHDKVVNISASVCETELHARGLDSNISLTFH